MDGSYPAERLGYLWVSATSNTEPLNSGSVPSSLEASVASNTLDIWMNPCRINHEVDKARSTNSDQEKSNAIMPSENREKKP